MSKLFLHLEGEPGLYLEVRKSEKLYLNDLIKANPYRDPSMGTFISGGAIKANTKDLSEELEELFYVPQDVKDSEKEED